MNGTRLMALSLVLLLGGCGDRSPTGPDEPVLSGHRHRVGACGGYGFSLRR